MTSGTNADVRILVHLKVNASKRKVPQKVEMQQRSGEGREVHITTQHPHPFSLGGGGCAVTSGGFQLAGGVNPRAGLLWTLGIGLYPVLVLGRVLGSGVRGGFNSSLSVASAGSPSGDCGPE